ncbi:SRPBCC domain-containing protein [Kitasatospora sp. NPDC093806]|uniref:SRPBCC domain-containing protein n=1 Tax=Kitasatospora sp. NPDC093806 TaxID=3155075 RepID=UPI003427B4D1
MAEIALALDIAAPRAVVLAALTTHDGLTAWWTTEVDRDAGDVLLLAFPDAPEPFRLRRERADLDRVIWTNVGSFPPHWTGTWISWELTELPDPRGESGHHTRLLFRHGGWQPGSEDGVPMVAGTWAQLLVRLKDYAQSGKAQPFFTTGHRHAE